MLKLQGNHISLKIKISEVQGAVGSDLCGNLAHFDDSAGGNVQDMIIYEAV